MILLSAFKTISLSLAVEDLDTIVVNFTMLDERLFTERTRARGLVKVVRVDWHGMMTPVCIRSDQYPDLVLHLNGGVTLYLPGSFQEDDNKSFTVPCSPYAVYSAIDAISLLAKGLMAMGWTLPESRRLP